MWKCRSTKQRILTGPLAGEAFRLGEPRGQRSGSESAFREASTGKTASYRPSASACLVATLRKVASVPPGTQRVEPYLGGEVLVVSVGLLADHLIPPVPGIVGPILRQLLKGRRRVSER